MKLHENNKYLTYNGVDMLNILKEIEYILISLHDMGSYYYEKDRHEYEKETTDFIDNSLVCQRLSCIRTMFSEAFDESKGEDDMDDIERVCLDIPYWSKPGDYTEEIWVKYNDL